MTNAPVRPAADLPRRLLWLRLFRRRRSAAREADASTPSLITALSPWQREAESFASSNQGSRLASIQRIFDAFDRDGDGTISLDEFRRCFSDANSTMSQIFDTVLHENELRELMHRFTTDHADGRIDFPPSL